MIKNIGLLFLLSIPVSLSARTYWYDIDYERSQIAFLAKSRVVNANGLFRKWAFKGKISANFHVVGDLTIDCTSIDTDNERRDKHLIGVDFFDCEKNPQHVFRVRSVKGDQTNSAKATKFEIQGELTIRGITQPVVFALTREGDEAKVTLVGSTIIDREKFGITYNSALNPIEKVIRLDMKLILNRRTDKP